MLPLIALFARLPQMAAIHHAWHLYIHHVPAIQRTRELVDTATNARESAAGRIVWAG